MANPLNTLLKPADVAQRLNVSHGTVLRFCRTGQIPAFRLGAQWRIDASDFQTWLAGQKNDSYQQLFGGQF